MQSKIIDGKVISKQLREELAEQVAKMSVKPGLAVILVGDDPASQVYVANKIKACANVGIQSRKYEFPKNTDEDEIFNLITSLNNDESVHGILLQLPLPEGFNEKRLLENISCEKDVDGLTTINCGKLFSGQKGLVPCTPQAALYLIKTVQSDLTGMNAVVIGRSLLFGKPMAQLLLAENCTVTQAHSKTRNLEDICKNADILVAAVGRPQMVKAEWIKDGAIVIDVGINRIPCEEDQGKTKLVGDVDFAGATEKAIAITPVPGGVGPMTIAFLLKNTIEACHDLQC